MNDIIDDIYMPLLVEHGFTAEPDNDRFGAMGLCWRLSEEIGQGYYWTYGQKNLFDIKVHDFYFHEDSFLELIFLNALALHNMSQSPGRN